MFCDDDGEKLLASNAFSSKETLATDTIADTTPRPEFGFAEVKAAQEELSASANTIEARYQLLSVIAQGGMGKLFLARERLSGRVIALKVMLAAAADNAEWVQQFVREAVITARLQHPNIIPVYDMGFFSDGQLYYTMRYVEGKPLSSLLTTLPLREKIRVLRDAAKAVHYGHTQNLWHRDLKPQNMLVGSFGEVYVIDWGLVSVLPGKQYELLLPPITGKPIDPRTLPASVPLFEEKNLVSTLASELFVGTPMYMSPEQAMSEARTLGAPSDIWAFGLMLYESLCGNHPYGEVQSLQEILMKARAAQLPLASKATPNVPRTLAFLCDRMLERDISERLPSLSVFISEASDWLEESASKSPEAQQSNEALDKLRAEHNRVVVELQRLSEERAKLQQKNKLLLELSQLGPFAISRKKEILAELVNL